MHILQETCCRTTIASRGPPLHDRHNITSLSINPALYEKTTLDIRTTSPKTSSLKYNCAADTGHKPFPTSINRPPAEARLVRGPRRGPPDAPDPPTRPKTRRTSRAPRYPPHFHPWHPFAFLLFAPRERTCPLSSFFHPREMQRPRYCRQRSCRRLRRSLRQTAVCKCDKLLRCQARRSPIGELKNSRIGHFACERRKRNPTLVSHTLDVERFSRKESCVWEGQ